VSVPIEIQHNTHEPHAVERIYLYNGYLDHFRRGSLNDHYTKMKSTVFITLAAAASVAASAASKREEPAVVGFPMYQSYSPQAGSSLRKRSSSSGIVSQNIDSNMDPTGVSSG
jgi:hypothetical protein